MSSLTSLCVYCGSSNQVDPGLLTAAYRFGALLAKAGVRLIYGGGRVGMMGRMADGCLAEGGQVTGIIPHALAGREIAHPGLSELILVDSMHERKRRMADSADGFAVLPGGYGTLDEMFEILTWRQLGLHDKPVVLVDLDSYWQPLLQMIDKMAQERFVNPDARPLFEVAMAIEDVLDLVAGGLSDVARSTLQ